jgi:hypothetical protein
MNKKILRCAKQKKNGESCKNKPWKNSRYCYVHSIVKPKGLNFLFNPRYQILAVVGILLTVLIIPFSATKRNQIELLRNDKSISKTVSENADDLKEIKSYFKKQMNKVETDFGSLLRERYPSGYCLVSNGKKRYCYPIGIKYFE